MRWISRGRGQGLPEYAIMGLFLAVGLVASFQVLRVATLEVFCYLAAPVSVNECAVNEEGVVVLASELAATSTPAPTNTPEPTSEETNTPTPTNTPEDTEEPTSTPVPTSTNTPTATATERNCLYMEETGASQCSGSSDCYYISSPTSNGNVSVSFTIQASILKTSSTYTAYGPGDTTANCFRVVISDNSLGWSIQSTSCGSLNHIQIWKLPICGTES